MQAKQTYLQTLLKNYGKVAVTFSGGIDSTLLLHQAREVLGKDNVLAVVVNSEFFQEEEYRQAMKIAKALDVSVEGVAIKELNDPDIANNTPDSWYASKKLLYGKVKETAFKKGIPVVLDGMIMDDLKDYRPGLRARDELGILSPLQLAKFYKPEVRELAKLCQLPTWNKPASCSVVSRFPYYHKITLEKVERVIEGEAYLQRIGFKVNRVRCHDDLARIEVSPQDFAKLLLMQETVEKKLKQLGFRYVTLDLRGYQMGRMNEALQQSKEPERKGLAV